MKLFTSIAAIIAVASAGQVYNQPQQYANTAEVFQSAIELNQHANYDQAQAYAGQNLAYQGRAALGEGGARILNEQSENNGHQYHYAYETENGIKAQEIGQTQGKGIQAQGGFAYTGDDGQTYTVTYTADENGFRPQGAHLPTPPPIPEDILKSLEQNARDEANGIYDDGHYKQQSQPTVQNYQQYDASAYQQEAGYHAAGIQATASANNGYQYHH